MIASGRVFLLCTCIYIASGGDVVILNDANFESTVLKNTGGDGWFVDFYAPWCPHCRTFAPIYESDAEWFLSTYTLHQDVRFGILNCDRFRELCWKQFNVTSYPTLKFFPSLCLNSNHTIQYKNSRSKHDRRRRWYAERVGVAYSDSPNSLEISYSKTMSLVPQVVVANKTSLQLFFSH